MQSCTKFFCRQLKYLSSNILFRYSSLHISTIGKSILRCETDIRLGNAIGFQQFTSQNVSPTFTAKRKTTVSSINDIKLYISEGKQFYLKLLTNILDTLEFETIASEDAELLLECCGQSVADSSKQNRNKVCQKIYEKLSEHNKLNVNINNIYIRICTENDVLLNITEFLKSLKCQPNYDTYKLLLSNVCEKGDVQQTYELLKLMKEDGISVDEDIFNKLVLGYTINNGLNGSESVLSTMKAARVPETTHTIFAVLKGVAKRNSLDDFENVLSKYKVELTESHILELVEVLCLSRNVAWLPKIKNLYKKAVSREFFNDLQKLCIHLVHMSQSESAITIYKEFVDPSTDENYAFFILKEMLHCNNDINKIISIAKNLHDEHLNIYALENLTRIALEHKYVEESWKLLENLSELRSHYFWPLLINAGRQDGENGLFSVMKKMVSMKVKVDSATLQFYVLPLYDPKSFKYVIKKLSNLGLKVSEAISPMLMVLIQKNELKQAIDLCNNYKVPISGDKFLNYLSSAWVANKDKESVALLLQRYCEDNLDVADEVGKFLINTLNTCRTEVDFASYLEMIQLIHKKGLRIDSTSATILHNICATRCRLTKTSERIRDEIDGLLNFELKSEIPHIPHPKNMNIEELECHLLELQEKGLGTRGVLRRLILLHSSFGNLQRVEELRKQFLDAGFEESIGMKSSLMHSYVKGAHLEAALNVYKEINTTHTNFEIDSFKTIDLATLLIKENRFDEAMEVMRTKTKSKNIGGPSIERNCKDLLNSFKNSDQQLQMYNLLVEIGYCKPTNIILGPIVRIHLSRGDLQKAVKAYIECSQKYKHTPLQLEIVREIVKSKDEVLLQTVLQATESVHGALPTQEVLIAALAENSQQNALIKLLANNKFSCKKELEKRCERWIHEGKVEALETLANACERLREKRVVDVNYVYNCIMQIFDINGDIKGATEFYEKLQEKDVIISKELDTKFNEMLKKCNKTSLYDKHIINR